RGGYSPAPPPRINWQGYYLGAQGGYGASDENFKGSTSNLAAALLADTLIEAEMGVSQFNLGLGKATARTSGAGAFAGYNSQWDDVVIGLEASYFHGRFGGSFSGGEARSSPNKLSDNLFHDVNATSTASISISDIATFRGRAAYAFGSFLPYLFGGLALGNADISRSITVQDATSSTGAPGSFTLLQPLTATDAVHNHLIYGYTAGLGVDVNLIGSLFLRAEWEYIRFTAAVDTNINTVRVGLGYKF
ncbi:MAG TPA: outer membrane beta-barrel protein, partial [Bradyrhizobium sp.]|nr:outer membrane beta-barrel protein [Bradyrhizobium sp.]